MGGETGLLLPPGSLLGAVVLEIKLSNEVWFLPFEGIVLSFDSIRFEMHLTRTREKE